MRIWVTYFAATFLFGGSTLLIAVTLFLGNIDMAKDLFLTVFPISAAIVTYWFAQRGVQQRSLLDEEAAQPPASVETAAAPTEQT